jgi:hypothetical protein
MPLDPAIGYAMVVFFFEDRLNHEYYSYVCLGLEVGGVKLNTNHLYSFYAHMRTCAHANQQNLNKNSKES